MKIAGLILAAGASRRMGRPKALLEYRGETFLDRLIGLLGAHCDEVVVVLGYHAAPIRSGIRRSSEARFVDNPDPARGQLSSLQTGLASVDVDALVFTPLDYPAVSGETVGRIAAALRAGAQLVAPEFRGRHGHPVGISRLLAEEILALPENSQAREAIHRHRATYLDVADAGILMDVDDPAAYGRLVEQG
ncbi:MAG: nucleotidyltransferase family protein [Acidobacteria bacterium]|nr:nucleotidyltransferase family protein [Acidobacteriota bacterium]